MSQQQSNGGLPPVAYVGMALVVGAAGWWFFLRDKPTNLVVTETHPPANTSQPLSPITANGNPTTTPDQLVAEWNISPATVAGSTSLAGLAEYLQEFGVTYEAKSSSVGIQELLDGQIGIAAISRPLSSDESFQGLIAHEIGQDALGFAIANTNVAITRDANGQLISPNFTRRQLQSMLVGNITNWQEVGGPNQRIDLVVRGEGGTYDSVKNLFGLTGFNTAATYLDVDSTTTMLNTLTPGSIGFATATQVCNQQKFTTLLIDGVDVSDPSYFPQRSVYFVTKGQPTPNQRKIIDLAKSIFSEELVASSVCS